MTLPREVVVPELLAEYQVFGSLVRGLDAEALGTTSRCLGWSVADVASHVIGQLSDVIVLNLEGLGTPEVTQRQVDERRGRSSAELADELESSIAVALELTGALDDAAWDGPSPQGVRATLGFGIESLLFDTALHADDIRSAVGLPSVPSEAIDASVSHVAQILTDQGWGPAELEFAGCGTFSVSGGGGTKVTGDAFAFVLAATGRGDPSPLGLDETVNIYRS